MEQHNTGLADCRRCGSCCVGPGSVHHVVYATHEDIQRMPKWFHRYVEPHENGWRLDAVDHLDGVACVAFVGRVGRIATCMIYNARPEVCRSFGEDGRGCESWLAFTLGRGRSLPPGIMFNDVDGFASYYDKMEEE